MAVPTFLPPLSCLLPKRVPTGRILLCCERIDDRFKARIAS